MRSKAGIAARAGLFLLFAGVLALLGPLETSAHAYSGSGAAVEESAAERKSHEHRDVEKKGERLPGAQLAQRIRDMRTELKVLPRSTQRPVALADPGCGPVNPRGPNETCGNQLRALLQVYRH